MSKKNRMPQEGQFALFDATTLDLLKKPQELPRETPTIELLRKLVLDTGFELQMVGENFFLEDPYLAGHGLREGTIEARTYSMRAIARMKNESYLCILPTAKGKTYIAIALMALQAENEGKIIYTTPTKVLTESNMQRIRHILPEVPVGLIYGNTGKRERFRIWDESKIICMTPQTLERSFEKHQELGDMRDVRCFEVDEVENFRGRYSYVINADYFNRCHKLYEMLGEYRDDIVYHAFTGVINQDIEKTRFIWESLRIPFKQIFARKETSPDILPYSFIKNIVYVPIAYSPPMLVDQIRHLYIKELDRSAKWLNEKLPFEIRNVISYDTKKQRYTGIKHDMIDKAKDFIFERTMDFGQNAGRMVVGLYFIDRLNKILDKIRNEGLFGLKEMLIDTYLRINESGNKKPSKNLKALWKSKYNEEAVRLLWENGIWEDDDPWPSMIEKPVSRNKNWQTDLHDAKLYTLGNILKRHECHRNKDKKTLIFILDKDHIWKIKKYLDQEFPMLTTKELVGSTSKRNKPKMDLEEQLNAISEFAAKKTNILISTSVGMTGLNFPSVDQVAFMEPYGYTELLNQGIGRTGRHADGWAYILYYHNNKKEMLAVYKIKAARKAMDEIIDYLERLGNQHYEDAKQKPLS